MRGEDPEVKKLTLSSGTLNVFRGKNTAHKVATVEGNKERLIAVFSYYEKPGVTFTREEQIGFYGRRRKSLIRPSATFSRKREKAEIIRPLPLGRGSAKWGEG